MVALTKILRSQPAVSWAALSVTLALSAALTTADSQPTAEPPDEHFKYASVGIEQQEGLPYWIWQVLPRMFPETLPGPGGYTSR